LPAVCS